ncbi:hypothetical protein FB45DRAFT_1079115 [Roridomyces roridus]|uniref:AMP-dependent synthetase/ligase domain-containing protein n=1 Tax=Roridomyces roridus TaxID=1738132 RepID=A0AAD7FZU2_9AGAR|nr:hypothetical protein FB45DRAFT_1079115 [Roridomyces roridus]
MTTTPLAIPELLDYTLAILDSPRDLCASALVQRSWVQPSQAQLFSHVDLRRKHQGDGFDARLARFVAILRASQWHSDLVCELVVTYLLPRHLEHLRGLASITFSRLTSFRLTGAGTPFSEAEALAIREILRTPSLVSLYLHLSFYRWQDFSRIWDECSRNIRHLACGVLLTSAAPLPAPTPRGRAPRIKLESFQSLNSAEDTKLWLQDTTLPFDLSALKAIKGGSRLDSLFLDVLSEAVESIEILSTNNWQGVQDLSRCRRIAQLEINVVTNIEYSEWAFFRTIGPEVRAHLQVIRFYLVSLSTLYVDELNKLLSEIQNDFPNLKVVHISYRIEASPLEELQLKFRHLDPRISVRFSGCLSLLIEMTRFHGIRESFDLEEGMTMFASAAGPVDGTLTIPQLIELQLEQSPHHTAFIYDLPSGEIVSIAFSQYIRTVHAAARRFLRDTAPRGGDGKHTVVGLFANTWLAFSLCYRVSSHIFVLQIASPAMCTGAMRAGMQPFNISPRNSPASLAYLLKQTDTAVIYVSSDLRAVVEEALQICERPLPVFDSLIFESLQSELAVVESTLPPVAATINGTALIIHSSGSTSTLSKPIYISHKLLLQYASNPWYSKGDRCGQVLSCHTLPNFHGIGMLMQTFPFSSGLIIAVPRPEVPYIQPTAQDAIKSMLTTKPDLVLTTPACIESWSEDPTAIQVLQSLKALKYIGAMLNKRVGDSLVAQGVVLCSAYGAMEIGLVTPFFTSHGKDWDYISLREGVDAVVLPENDGSGMYTHTYLVGPHFAAAFTNEEIEGHVGCTLSDLLEQHPDAEKSHLHRVYERKDDLIPFSSAAKMNPVPLEAQINRNPYVENSLVFGHGRSHPVMYVL